MASGTAFGELVVAVIGRATSSFFAAICGVGVIPFKSTAKAGVADFSVSSVELTGVAPAKASCFFVHFVD